MFEKLFCNHEWEIVSSLLDCVVDENGKKTRGTRHSCKCKKCGKEKIVFEKENLFENFFYF